MEYIEIAASVYVHPSGEGKMTFSTNLPFGDSGFVLEYTPPTALHAEAQMPSAYIDYLTEDDLRGIVKAATAVLDFAEAPEGEGVTTESLATTAYDDADRIVVDFDFDDGVADVSFRYMNDEPTLWLEAVTPDGFDRLAALFAQAADTLRTKGQ